MIISSMLMMKLMIISSMLMTKLMINSSILTIKLMIVSSMLITFSILMIDRPQKLVSPATFCLRLKGPLNLDSGLMLTDLPYRYISFTR